MEEKIQILLGDGYNDDHTKYQIEHVLGNRTVGHGLDLETSGYDSILKNMGYDTSFLAYIPIEIVDEIINQEIKNWYEKVKSSMSANGVTAKEYQLYAFTDFCYNCGAVNDFYQSLSVGEAYKTHYDSQIDNWYGDYTNYDKTEKIAAKMLQYDTDISYNQRRRAADGCLFQTGYYGYDIKRTDISTDNRGADAYYTAGGTGGPVQDYLKKIQDEGIKCDGHNISLAAGVTYNHNKVYGASQCKGYAMCVYVKCFGIVPSAYPENQNYVLNPNDKMTLVGTIESTNEQAVKELFLKARSGDFIQMQRAHGGPHSAIVYTVNDDGTMWMENNSDGNCGTYLNTYSWSDLVKANKYISIYTAKEYNLKGQ